MSSSIAAPLVKLGTTKVQLTKPSTVACTATDFYPGNISMTWFRNDRIVQGPEWPPAQPSTGQLFRAESLLKLIPEFSDASANYSCQIRHQACKGPEVLKFQLHLQGEYNLLLRKQGTQAIFLQVQWLQNGVPQKQIKSEVHRMHNGMFSINSVFLPQKNNIKVTYVCRVEHEGFETPLEQSVRWRPGPSAVVPWLLGFIIGFGFGLALAATIAYYKEAALTVTVPEGPIQAKPGSDVLLPCYFEESSGHIDLFADRHYTSHPTRDIAKYEDKLEVFHPGAKMSSEGLQRGNASILLPNVQDADGTTYTCFVIHSPDSEKESIELRVEGKGNQGKQNEGQMITLFKGRRQH
ncbi:Ig lambda-2 chain C region, partial [Ophiophagus hannah]